MKGYDKSKYQIRQKYLPSLIMIFHFLSLVLLSIESQASEISSCVDVSIVHHDKKQFATPIIEITQEELNEDEQETDHHNKRKLGHPTKSSGISRLVINQFLNVLISSVSSLPKWELISPFGKFQIILFHQFKIDL